MKTIGKRINFSVAFIHFVVLLVIIYSLKVSGNYTNKSFPVLLFVYYTLVLLLRNIVPIYHRKGIRQLRKGNVENAIKEFKKSYNFFTKHFWLDKYRSIFILSISSISYRELALNNIGFCYSQIGKGDKAIEYYEQGLKEFPDSILINNALRMIMSVKNDITT